MGDDFRRILRICSYLSMDLDSISICDVVQPNLDEAIGEFTRLPKMREQTSLCAPASQGNMTFPLVNIKQDRWVARISLDLPQISQWKSNSASQTLNWGEKTREQERLLVGGTGECNAECDNTESFTITYRRFSRKFLRRKMSEENKYWSWNCLLTPIFCPISPERLDDSSDSSILSLGDSRLASHASRRGWANQKCRLGVLGQR